MQSPKSRKSRDAPRGARQPEGAREEAAPRGALGGLLALARSAGNAAIERLVGAGNDEQRGSALDASTAARMGAAYGVDLHDVQLVDDAESRAAAQSLDARAFTVGDSIFLGADAPSRETPEGEALVAHELAHVAQQRQAPAVRDGAVSAAGDAHEVAADGAASRAVAGQSAHVAAGGAPAAVQREPIKPSVTKRAGMARGDAQKVLERYFTRILAAQGGKTVSVTPDVKGDIRALASRIKDASTVIRFEGWLAGNQLPGSPAELAQRVAALLPEVIDPSAIAPMDVDEYSDSVSPAATDTEKSTRLSRVVDLVKGTSPDVGADAQEHGWKFDQMTSDMRTNDKPVLGPLKTITPSLDLERIWNIGKGFGKAWNPPAAKTQPKSFATVDAVIDSLSPTSLVPKAVQGKPQADDYANARDLAGGVARDLDVAQQKKQYTVKLQLGANYRNVDDKFTILDEVERIVLLVRDAMPHHASKVGQVEVYIGELRFRVIKLHGGGP